MADAYFFVDPVNGVDATGTGAYNAPVKTITKAIGASGVFNSSLTTSGVNYCVLMPGIYRETLALGAAPTSSGPLVVIGDSDGALQRTAGSTTPVTGLVDWRGWSNDTTQLTGATLISASGKSYVTLQNLKMYGSTSGGTPGVFDISGTFQNWNFINCTFISSRTRPTVGYLTGTAGAALNVVFDRCQFYGPQGIGIDIRMPLHSAEYDINLLVQNCFFLLVTPAIRLVQSGGSGTGFATGLKVQNCTYIACNTGVSVAYSTNVLSSPSSVYGCEFFWGTTSAVVAGHVSQLVEAGNVMEAPTPRQNVSAGSGSTTTACCAVDLNDHLLSGLAPRPFGTPSLVGPGVGGGTFGTIPAYDATNRPRPAGFGSASGTIGCFERHDTAAKESTTTDAGDGAKIVGPGDQQIAYAVDATSTTISVKCRYDTNHGATTKPQVVMLAAPEIGVTTAQTLTMSAAVDTWETLTFAAITPTAKGRVLLRFVARPSAASGIMFFDTVAP